MLLLLAVVAFVVVAVAVAVAAAASLDDFSIVGRWLMMNNCCE